MACVRERVCSKISTDMRHLVNNTHLVSPSESLILLRGEMDNMYKEKKLEEIVVINLSGHYLINLGYLTNCWALRICILSRNYITDIDALSYCPHLIKLDVHANHITDLPDEFFWSNMICLQILYLHDNIIGDLNSIKPLYYCPSLIVLTLFDTPVSLVPKYRHNLVNNIWTLKVLDNFVIADEEVIEDCLHSDQFKALSPHFLIHLPEPPQISTWQSELKHIEDLFSLVNNILTHRSPVLIIQRWVRGHMTRKKLRAFLNPRKHQRSQVAGELCEQGIHVLDDGNMWVEGSTEDDQCNAVGLQVDINKLQLELLEDRCEAKEITSGIFPCISHWRKSNTPHLKPKKSSIFQPRTFREPMFDPQSDDVRLL
uniref:leucine-rich repeat and IQ domain-containing protein 3-like isoform X2 n=1 Tax=Pristiophorus japonicus TaxID=55135 RepID=UPI00398E5382